MNTITEPFLMSLKVLKEICVIWGDGLWEEDEGRHQCTKNERIIPLLAVTKCSATTLAEGSQLTTWVGTSSLKWRLHLLCMKVRYLYKSITVGKRVKSYSVVSVHFNRIKFVSCSEKKIAMKWLPAGVFQADIKKYLLGLCLHLETGL